MPPTTRGVYLAVLNQGSIRTELSTWVNDQTHQHKYRLYVSYPSERPISNNRNQIVLDFLKRKEYEYLMMVDSDIIPPSNYLELVDFQKDIISGVCFAYMDSSVIPLVLDNTPEEEQALGKKAFSIKNVDGTEGLVPVGAVGTGAIIIHRRVLEKVAQPFLNRYDEKGVKIMGLDLSFCKKAGELGFQTWCHLDYICSHLVTLDLKNVYRAITNRDEITKAKIK